MKLHLSILPSLLFLTCSFGCTARASLLSEHSRRDESFIKLSAVSRRGSPDRRSLDFEPSSNVDLFYSDSENDGAGHAVFMVQVHAESDDPILVLEDMEHGFERIECGLSTIRLDFASRAGYDSARESWRGLGGGYVVTSHEGCNIEGERLVFKVRQVNIVDEDYSITFDVTETLWKEAFSSVTLSFGHSDELHGFRRRASSFRRQDLTSETSTTIDLSSKLLDSRIPVHKDVPFTLSCKNCTTTGSLELTRGEFTFAQSITDWADGNPIQSGFVQATMTGFEAYIQLESALAVKDTFSWTLFSVPIKGFQLSDDKKLQFEYAPSIAVSYELDSGIDFVYGFDLKFPSNPMVKLDFANPVDDSSFQGFDSPEVTALPFTANFSTPSILFNASLQHSFMFTLQWEEKESSAGVLLKAPAFNAIVAPADGVDQNCNPLDNVTSSDVGVLNKIGDIVHIDIDVGLGLVVAAELGGFTATQTLTATSFPDMVPTGCYAYYDHEFTPAAAAYSLVQSGKSAAGASVYGNNPIGSEPGSGRGLLMNLCIWVMISYTALLVWL